MIIDNGDFVQLNKFYDSYNFIEKFDLENAIIRHMILSNIKFEDIEGQVPKDLYERSVNRKKRVIEEDKSIRERLIIKLCEVKDDEHLVRLMKFIEPLLRNKKRTILIMGGNYEEVNKETKQDIVKVMTSIEPSRGKGRNHYSLHNKDATSNN